MTITDNQLILALVCGVSGLFVAFVPFVGVLAAQFGNEGRNGGGSSIFSFLVKAVVFQFIVTVFFYGIVKALDATMKGGMKVLGDGGAFDLFWKIDVIYATQTAETVTTLINIIRETAMLANAYIPIFAVFGGIIFAYHLADQQMHSRGTAEREYDFMNYAVKMVVGGFIAAIAYAGWAKIASYSLFLPSAVQHHEQGTLIDKSNEYWRGALGVSKGKDASEIIIK